MFWLESRGPGNMLLATVAVMEEKRKV